MPSFYTHVEINAPRALVWEILIRKDQWRWWNTFLYDGNPAQPFRPGEAVSLGLCRLEGDELTDFESVVTLMQPQQCLGWRSQLPGFSSEHRFELQDLGPYRTHYIHRERITGLLSKVFWPFIRQDEKQGLQRMAHQIKRHAERWSWQQEQGRS